MLLFSYSMGINMIWIDKIPKPIICMWLLFALSVIESIHWLEEKVKDTSAPVGGTADSRTSNDIFEFEIYQTR